MSRLAILTPKRQIDVLDAEGRRRRETFDDVPAWGQWRAGPGQAWAWPTWDPAGRRLAAFRMTLGERPATAVVVFEPGSVSQIEVADLGSRLPIYLYWAPDPLVPSEARPRGVRLAVLSQEDERLVLSTARASEPGSERMLAEASPLFFTWLDDRIAAYLGRDGSQGGQMTALSCDTRERTPLPGDPVNFCAPVAYRGEVVYVAQTSKGPALVRAAPGDAEPTVLEPVHGLVALVPSPDGRRVARATANDGDGTPYRDLAIVDLETGAVTPVDEGPFLAFFWAPGDDRLVGARVDTRRNVVQWSLLIPGAEPVPLHEIHPTRDLGFYLRFFEQYSQSHRLVDPTGRYLALAGWSDRRERGQEPRVVRVPLDGGPREDLGPGNLAVWSP